MRRPNERDAGGQARRNILTAARSLSHARLAALVKRRPSPGASGSGGEGGGRCFGVERGGGGDVCVVCVREREKGRVCAMGLARWRFRGLAQAGATLEHAGGNILKACARLQCFAQPRPAMPAAHHAPDPAPQTHALPTPPFYLLTRPHAGGPRCLPRR